MGWNGKAGVGESKEEIHKYGEEEVGRKKS
jgi:hypothetical protein